MKLWRQKSTRRERSQSRLIFSVIRIFSSHTRLLKVKCRQVFFFSTHCQVSSSTGSGISRTIYNIAKCHFRPSIFQNGSDKRCVIVAKNIYIQMNMSERISRKSRVNDSVCLARMCNKIELAIDPGETSGNYQRGRKKRVGRMRYLSDGAIVTSARKDN